MEDAVKKAGLWGTDQELKFPLIVKSGTNQQGKTIHYYFNYSAAPVSFTYPYKTGTELLSGSSVNSTAKTELAPWGVKIVEEN
jgi:beta-galactosidase